MSSSSGSHAWIQLTGPVRPKHNYCDVLRDSQGTRGFPPSLCGARDAICSSLVITPLLCQGEQIQVNVLSNDALVDAKALRVVNVSSPNTLKGSVAIGVHGVSISYSAPQDFAGTEVFRYEVVNRFGARSSRNCHDRGKWQRSRICSSLNATLATWQAHMTERIT